MEERILLFKANPSILDPISTCHLQELYCRSFSSFPVVFFSLPLPTLLPSKPVPLLFPLFVPSSPLLCLWFCWLPRPAHSASYVNFLPLPPPPLPEFSPHHLLPGLLPDIASYLICLLPAFPACVTHLENPQWPCFVHWAKLICRHGKETRCVSWFLPCGHPHLCPCWTSLWFSKPPIVWLKPYTFDFLGIVKEFS